MEKKITVQCCVPSCYNTNHMSPQILFFPFPKRREMQEKWLHAIHRPELKKILPVDKPFHMFICLNHFKGSDVVQINQRTCLRAGVIPSVFKWSSTTTPDTIPSTSPAITSSYSADSTSSGSKRGSSTQVTAESKEAIRRKLDNQSLRRSSSGITDDVVIINCGNLNAELHRDKFYCPGIHRECIKYNNQFITPKMFMIMGDKEKLKDWKNAIRIGGIKIRKFIESKKLDFHKHKEFCTGRCVARLPTGLFRTRNQPPEDFVNTSGDISHIKFAEGDSKPDVHCFRVEPTIETEYDDEDSDESIIDEKPDIETLNALLKNPIPTAMLEKGPSSNYGITDSQMFWRGISKLGLIDTVFDIVKNSFTQLRTNFILHDARAEDAHLLSSVIREMGLSNKIQHMLASSKQDMDNHYDKLDKEMQELQQKVNQYESRKRMLKKRSEEFKAILDMNNPKHQNTEDTPEESLSSLKRQGDSPPEEGAKRFKFSHSENLKRILQAPQGSLSGESTSQLMEDIDAQTTFVMAKDSLKPGQILKIIPSETGGAPLIIQKNFDADEYKSPEESPVDSEDNLPKIVSVESINENIDDAKMPSSNSDDNNTVDELQNGIVKGQSMTEKLLKSVSDEKNDDDDNDDDAIDDDDLMETMEMYGDGKDSSQMKVIKDPSNPNSQLIIWKRSDGKAETFRFSNNSEITQSGDEKTDSSQSVDEKTEKSSNQEGENISSNEIEGDSTKQKEDKDDISTDAKKSSETGSTTNEDEESETTYQIFEKTHSANDDSEKSSKSTDENCAKVNDNHETESVSEISKKVQSAESKVETRSLTENKNSENSGVDSDSNSTSIPDTPTSETIATRRSSRKRFAKVKDDL